MLAVTLDGPVALDDLDDKVGGLLLLPGGSIARLSGLPSRRHQDLGQHTRLIDALSTGDVTLAMTALDEHARRSPDAGRSTRSDLGLSRYAGR